MDDDTTVLQEPTANAATDRLAERLLRAAAETMNLFCVVLGDQLGYYRVLADDGPLTSAELARRTGTAERQAREWLEQQTVAGILVVDDPALAAERRRFRLPDGHVPVLADDEHLAFMAGVAQVTAGAVLPLDDVCESFRTGRGVPFARYGRHLRDGQARMNKPMFLHQLGPEWLAGIPAADAALRRPGARVADVGCGCGWSSIGVARHYPGAEIDGIDLDAPSIEDARRNAAAAGVAGRVRFAARDAGDPELAGRYDLVLAFECVHDMGDPVAALRAMRGLAKDDGVVLVVDERAGERFTGEDQGGVESLLYGFSVTHCLQVGLADGGCCGGTGTVMRPAVLEGYARQAGFAGVEVLDVDHFLFRFYRLVE